MRLNELFEAAVERNTITVELPNTAVAIEDFMEEVNNSREEMRVDDHKGNLVDVEFDDDDAFEVLQNLITKYKGTIHTKMKDQ